MEGCCKNCGGGREGSGCCISCWKGYCESNWRVSYIRPAEEYGVNKVVAAAGDVAVRKDEE